MHTETITIYSYSELSEEAKATAYKAWEPPHVGGVLYCLRNRGDGVHIQFLLPFVGGRRDNG